MNTVRNANRKVIVSVIMTLMLIAAMMPGMAFAAEGYGVTITGPTTATTNEVVTMEKEITTPNDEAVHVDWVILENGTTADATISLHNGKLTATTAGTVVVEARLIAGAAPTPGTGGGQGQPCDATPLATDTCEVTVSSTDAYGFQGEGGNMLKMLDPSDVGFSYMDVYSDASGTEKNCYINTINENVVATPKSFMEDDGTSVQLDAAISFGYTMSAGINNFNENIFETYKSEIGIYDTSSNERVADVEYEDVAMTADGTRMIKVYADAADLSNGGAYTLRFGPTVCGNNESKKLDCFIDFQFTLQK